MKKIFLVFGIAAFSGAAAQQKDLFDISRHLQKKTADKKQKTEKVNIPLPFNNAFINGLNPVALPESSYSLPNGDKVIVSKTDRMPCIKPDMNRFNSMPNLAQSNTVILNYFSYRSRPGQIPNASRFHDKVVPGIE